MPLPQGEVTLGVSLEDASRTELGAFDGKEYPVLWTKGDKVLVNGVESAEVDASFVGSNHAKFNVAGVQAPFTVVYPVDAVKKSLVVDGMHAAALYIDPEQEYAANSFADKVAVMIGYSENSQISMKNAFGFVKVVIAKGDDVALKGVTLETLDGTPISGEVLVGEQASWVWCNAGCNYIRVAGADGIPYEGGKATVIFAVPAGTYAKGFKVTIEDAAGKAMEKTAYATTGIEIKGGVMLAMPEVTYAGAEQVGIVIRNAEQLNAFLAAVNAGD